MKLKWLFAAFVLANLGLWMWASWYREQPMEERRATRPPLAQEKIRLLAEAGGVLGRFFARVRELAALPRAARDAQLR